MGLLVAASGCAPLRFEGLQKASKTGQAPRVSQLTGAAPTAAYRLQPQDELEFAIPRPNGASAPIQKIRVNGAEAWQSRPSPTFRIPVGLASNTALSFDAAALGAGSEDFGLDLDRKTWGQVRLAAIAANAGGAHALPADAPDAGTKVRFRLIPSASPDMLAQGDRVQVWRRYRVKVAYTGPVDPNKPQPDPFSFNQSESFELQVDATGGVLFPAPAKLSGVIGVDADPAAREIFARLEGANARLQVADPAAAYDAQLSLADLAACLSQGDLFDESDTTSRCWKAGVRRALAPTADGSASITDLVYRLQPAARGWWLVDETGRRVEVPLQAGDTTGPTVAQAYARAFGRSMFHGGYWRVFVVVQPRQTVASNREAPFYLAALKKGAAPTDYLLRPGDTVFVTRERPLATKSPP